MANPKKATKAPSKSPSKSKKATKTPKASPPKSKKPATVSPLSPPAPGAPKSAYQHFLARAQALPRASVPVARFAVSIARANVDRAAAALAPHLAELPGIAPRIDVARLRDLPALARALEYAASLVPADPLSDGSLDGALQEIAPLRMAALAYLDAAAYCGFVDAARVRAIRVGHGRLDLAQDAVAIAGLFEEEAGALAGKHPFTDAQLATLRDRGAWLAGRIKPTGAVRDPAERGAAAQTKDRFAKLLEDDYARLLDAAAAVWGVEAMWSHVPALHVQAQARGKKANGAKSGKSASGAKGAAPAAGSATA